MPPDPTSFKALTDSDIRVKIVDIGANFLEAEGKPPYAGLLQEGEADVVGFEPNPVALERLQAIKGPHETYLPDAVADGKRHTLRFCHAEGMTSLLEPNPVVLDLFHGMLGAGFVVKREELATVRLDDVPETADVDLIKIDIQGGELLALSHATERLKDALVIHTEVEFMPMYVDQPLFSDVDQFLRAQGFMFHRFHPGLVSRVFRPLNIGNNPYAGMSQVLWADALFVRDLTRLDLLSERQLLKLAKILHDCYQSYDITLHILEEYGRRSGIALNDTYFRRLSQIMRTR